MRTSWSHLVPAMRVHVIVAIVCIVVCVIGIVLVVVGVPTLWLVVLMLAVVVGGGGSFIVTTIVGSRQEIDAAVERGRQYDEEHGEGE